MNGLKPKFGIFKAFRAYRSDHNFYISTDLCIIMKSYILERRYQYGRRKKI